MDFDLVVIGASLGGLHALEIILGGLEEGFSLPVAIVQHRGKGLDQKLAQILRNYSMSPVLEVDDKDEIVPGRVYLAPADYHLLVEDGYFALSIDEPVNNARPSIDILFETASDVYAQRLIGLILTGRLYDGARGLAKIKKRGGYTIVQDPKTAEADDMPLAALASTEADNVLPVEEIAPLLMRLDSSNAGK